MNARREVVYVVDDDSGVREALSQLLKSLGIDSVGFGSANEYLEFTRADEAACLILDLQLPGISGLELQRRLTASESPPVIFISGRLDIPSTVEAMKAGAIEFLTKPVRRDALLAAVSAGLARDRTQREDRLALDELKRRLALLSPREREVLSYVVAGFLNKESAAALGISAVTLQAHRSQIMRKMAADSLAELVRMASALGIETRQR